MLQKLFDRKRVTDPTIKRAVPVKGEEEDREQKEKEGNGEHPISEFPVSTAPKNHPHFSENEPEWRGPVGHEFNRKKEETHRGSKSIARHARTCKSSENRDRLLPVSAEFYFGRNIRADGIALRSGPEALSEWRVRIDGEARGGGQSRENQDQSFHTRFMTYFLSP